MAQVVQRVVLKPEGPPGSSMTVIVSLGKTLHLMPSVKVVRDLMVVVEADGTNCVPHFYLPIPRAALYHHQV